jgi:Protein of unknown function (DUF2841)
MSRLQDDYNSQTTERSNSTERAEIQSQVMIEVELGNKMQMRDYLFDAFTAFQQINCRTLCKSWIRTIEPKKQVNHPYNGNLKPKGMQKFPQHDSSNQKDSDPEETKPRWWPSRSDCPHKEPDHIKKERECLSHENAIPALTNVERLALLCHILMNTGELHDCQTEDLRKAIESDKVKIKPIEKYDILEDVWKIGHELERVKRNEIGELRCSHTF